MKLKTLKELVDEFGDRLHFDGSGDLNLKNDEHELRYMILPRLGTDYEGKVPDWVKKKPKKKKLYAYRASFSFLGYDDTGMEMIYYNEKEYLGDTATHKRVPKYDKEFIDEE